MDIEANLLPVMSTVTCNAKRQYHRTCRKVENLGTIELNDAGRVFVLLAFRGFAI